MGFVLVSVAPEGARWREPGRLPRFWSRILSDTVGSPGRMRIVRFRGSGGCAAISSTPRSTRITRIVKRTGDGSLIEFRSVVDAVRCAIELQSGLTERNAGLAPERRIELRVGIHLGDVVEEADGDLMGDGVNIAARLERVCKPGAICLSEDAYRQVKDASIWRSPTSAKLSSRTSPIPSGFTRCRSASPPRKSPRRRQNRSRPRSAPRRRRSPLALASSRCSSCLQAGHGSSSEQTGPRRSRQGRRRRSLRM